MEDDPILSQASVTSTTTMVALNLPDLDLTILEAIQHNEIHNPEYPIFRYANEDGSTQSITWSEAGKAFTRAGHFISGSLSSGATRQADVPSAKIVGMLANLGRRSDYSDITTPLMSYSYTNDIDSITFFSIIVGVMRAGLVPFLISTRNSPEAVAHLLASTGSQVLLISEDPVINELVGAATKLLEATGDSEASGPIKIQTIIAPSFEQLYGDGEATIPTKGNTLPMKTMDDNLEKWDRPCLIVHSSGTTSHPKPISLTERLIHQHCSMNRECEC